MKMHMKQPRTGQDQLSVKTDGHDGEQLSLDGSSASLAALACRICKQGLERVESPLADATRCPASRDTFQRFNLNPES